MPGVVMDHGDRNGSHTNHDRDRRPNGVNGGNFVSDKAQDKGKGREPQQNMTPTSPSAPGLPNGMPTQNQPGEPVVPPDLQERVDQLPPEIAHITEGYVPLSRLITRMAQKSHHDISTKILELAQMPVPTSAVNGNVSYISSVDDNSAENVIKKQRLLDFAQSQHADWTKAYVITKWSQHSEDISKVIDLKVHLDHQAHFYSQAIDALVGMATDLPQARVPNPDLKTALQVLSTGKAPWMPELNYIEPPRLTARDLVKTLENLNTLLSIRLNLHEYDTIPIQFRDYTIKSGRVTFKVAGEFEVDLTIADEDPQSQFWFIDFRFLFSPTLSQLSPNLYSHIENRVNAALLKDGLLGCYTLLHGIVLTHKISEFRRQAVQLARGKWIDGLKVELLNRSLSIQYWLDRYGRDGPKSWIILGVHSGRRKDGRPDLRTTSRLSIRWFQNAKEVHDVDIPFDTIKISAESLLKTVIAKHVNHILTSIYEAMQSKPLFASHEAALSLSISSNEPAESELKVQLSSKEHLTVTMEPVTGRFIFSPASPMITQTEYRFNTKSIDPTKDGHQYLENLRCMVISDDTTNHGLSTGWIRSSGLVLKNEELKTLLPKETLQIAWFRRSSWTKDWHALLTLSMSGERWFLVQSANTPTGVKVASSFEIPINGVTHVPTYSFFSRLNIMAAGLISDYVNLQNLHSRRASHAIREGSKALPIKLPFILLRLSELLPSKNMSSRTGQPWARDVVKLYFQGLELDLPREHIPIAGPTSNSQLQTSNIPAVGTQPMGSVETETLHSQEEGAVIIFEARMTLPVPERLTVLRERVDRDIAFHAESGTFAFRLRCRVGESIIPAFIESAMRVERLVNLVGVLDKHEKLLKCEFISLGKIIFTYGTTSSPTATATDAMDIDCTKSKTYKAIVDFGAVDNVTTLVFEQGNPHLRIADYLTQVLNGKEGLDGVATMLPITLPTLRALDTLEGAWTSLSTKGEVFIFVRAADWFIIRYNLFPSSSDSTPQTNPHKVMLEIKLQERNGIPWWYIRRTDPRDREGDKIDEALKPVWNSKGTCWQGMRVSAVAEPSGVEELMEKLDEVLRNVNACSDGIPATAAPAQAPVKPLQRAPEAPMQRAPEAPMQVQSQRPQQQPTPNQSQSQGRVNVKREVVEID